MAKSSIEQLADLLHIPDSTLSHFFEQHSKELQADAASLILLQYFRALDEGAANERFAADLKAIGAERVLESRNQDDLSPRETKALFHYFCQLIYLQIMSTVAKEVARDMPLRATADYIAVQLTQGLYAEEGESFQKLQRAWREVLQARAGSLQDDFQFHLLHYTTEVQQLLQDAYLVAEIGEPDDKKQMVTSFIGFLYDYFGRRIPGIFTCGDSNSSSSSSSSGGEDEAFVSHIKQVLGQDLNSEGSVETAFSSMKAWLDLVSKHHDRNFLHHILYHDNALKALMNRAYTHLPEVALSGVGYAYLVEIVKTYCSYDLVVVMVVGEETVPAKGLGSLCKAAAHWTLSKLPVITV